MAKGASKDDSIKAVQPTKVGTLWTTNCRWHTSVQMVLGTVPAPWSCALWRSWLTIRASLHSPRAPPDARSSPPQKAALTDDIDTVEVAHQVARDVHRRWRAQTQRWADYRALVLLLAFTALYLAVLCCQRSAHVSYQVHSTIDGVVAPAQGSITTISDVYSWLQGLLQVC